MRLVAGLAGLFAVLALAAVVSWSIRRSNRTVPEVPTRNADATKVAPKHRAPRLSTAPSRDKMGLVPGSPAPLPSLPRKLADLHPSEQARAAIQRRWGRSPQYLVGVDTSLEVLARLDDCIDSRVVDGYLDLHLWTDPDPKNHVLHIKPVLEGLRTNTPAEEEVVRRCVETQLSGITEPTVDPEFDRETMVTKMWITFPIEENVLYHFLMTGEDLPAKYVDEMPEVAEEKRLQALAKQFAEEAAKKKAAASGAAN